MERIPGNSLKTPACLRAVRPRPELNYVRPFPAADLFLVMIAGWISPGDAPCLEGRIPDAQGGAVHVHRLIETRTAFGSWRHDPNILNGATFEDPAGMDFTFDTTRGNVISPVGQDIEVPASDQPAIDIG